MTNKEFYSTKLLAIAIWQRDKCQLLHKLVFNKTCQKKRCSECEFCNVESIENWLNTEHVKSEPPLLENGDDLKPGDWIMVRNSDKEAWTSQVFLCFIYDYFVCVCDKEYIGHGGNYQLWKQARLPEEGE